MIHKDIATLSALVGDDWTIQDKSGSMGTKAGFINDVKSGKLVVTSFKLHDLHVRVLGNVAFVQAFDDEISSYERQRKQRNLQLARRLGKSRRPLGFCRDPTNQSRTTKVINRDSPFMRPIVGMGYNASHVFMSADKPVQRAQPPPSHPPATVPAAVETTPHA